MTQVQRFCAFGVAALAATFSNGMAARAGDPGATQQKLASQINGNQVRYYGEIRFPFQKGAVPPVDDLVKTVSAVIGVQPADNADQGGQGDQGGQPAAAAPASAPMPEIAPPPPPVDTPPPTIALGQTVDLVTASFGQPTRVAKLGAKTIYFDKDMKVTFTSGKVSNVQQRVHASGGERGPG
jgi:hypothetical protein